MKKKAIEFQLSVDDAETLLALLDGCVGTSENEDFNNFAKPLIKVLEKRISGYYIKFNQDGK